MPVTRFPSVNKTDQTDYNLGCECSIGDEITINDLSYKDLGVFVTVSVRVFGSNPVGGYESILDKSIEKIGSNLVCNYTPGSRAYWIVNKSLDTVQWTIKGANQNNSLLYNTTNIQKKFNDDETITTKGAEGEININRSINSTLADYGCMCSFSSNAPIFENETIGQQYMALPDDDDAEIEFISTYAVNFGSIYDPDKTKEYYIYNTFDTATIDDNGSVSYTGGDPTGRFIRFRANQTPVMYWVDKGGSLELSLIAPSVVASVYSSINSYDVEQKSEDPSAWVYGELVYPNPWYNVYGSEAIPSGDYTIGVTFLKSPEILIFNNEADARGYLDGTVSDEEAWDWGSSGNINIAENETGIKELVTEFGGNLSENVFSHDYLMSRSQLADIGGEFFDSNVLSALLDGLKLYGNDPMNSVLSCLYFPFDLSTVCTTTAVTDIYFGAYKMKNKSANKVKSRSGYKELGSTFIKPTFKNFLDYKAQHIYLYLPYIGFVELDVNKYLNKWLHIIYMIDIHSGECEVSLTASSSSGSVGCLMDTYSGQIGIKQPLTWQDLSTYFQSQITALRNGVMSAVGGPIAGAGTGAQIGSSGGPYGMLAGAVTGASVGQMVGTANGMWQGWKVAHTKPPMFSKGGYSSEVGANMPQYAFLVFLYNEVEIPENMTELYGRPSNKSGSVGSFYGFLSTNYVKLQVPTATDGEKNEILSLLNSGIYI